jgi:hypothetical protein
MIGTNPCTLAYWLGQVGDMTSTVQNVAYNAPDRSPASYNALNGGAATLGAFLQEARRQSSAHWRARYTGTCVAGYVRRGF